jgi:hypothetical protein
MAGLIRIECAALARGIWAKRELPMWGFAFGKPGPWMMAERFDTIVTRDPGFQKREQFSRLPRQIAYAMTHAPAFARIIANIDPEAITSPGALARLPVTRKSELIRLQSENRPLGGLASVRWGEAARVFASPTRTIHWSQFCTGDLSALLLGISACSRIGARIKGWMGRADQTTKVLDLTRPKSPPSSAGIPKSIRQGWSCVTRWERMP